LKKALLFDLDVKKEEIQKEKCKDDWRDVNFIRHAAQGTD